MLVNWIFNNVWVLFILVSVLNAFYLRIRSKKFIEKQPELKEGFDRLITGELIYLNIPWVVAGIGIVFGGVPGFLSYLTPRHGNLFVLAFHATIIALWIFTFWWIYFKGGAEFLVKYSGMANYQLKSPVFLKFLFALELAFGIAGMVLMWSL